MGPSPSRYATLRWRHGALNVNNRNLIFMHDNKLLSQEIVIQFTRFLSWTDNRRTTGFVRSSCSLFNSIIFVSCITLMNFCSTSQVFDNGVELNSVGESGSVELMAEWMLELDFPLNVDSVKSPAVLVNLSISLIIGVNWTESRSVSATATTGSKVEVAKKASFLMSGQSSRASGLMAT